MSSIAIIPARGGSKRIPFKNIRDFDGRPMIAYAINAALDSKIFDKVIVSSDSDEIIALAQNLGVEVPFKRPKELADDFTPTLPVIHHALTEMKARGHDYDFACCIYATNPFLTIENLKKAHELLIQSKSVKYVFAATKYSFPIQRAFHLSKSGDIEMFWPEHLNTRSQDLKEAFHDAGQFYWGEVDAFMQELPIFAHHSKPIILPPYLVQDIDTMDDWLRAEYMHQAINKK